MNQTSETIDRTEIERCVVGSMLFSTEAAEFGAGELNGSEFSRMDMRTQFKGTCDLLTAGLPFDAVILAEQLAKRGTLAAAGGALGIAETIGSVFHAEHCRYYVQQLQTIHKRDCLRLLSERLQIQSQNPSIEPSETIDNALNELESLRAGLVRQSELITTEDALKSLEATDEAEELGAVIPTGLAELDRALCGGFRGGQLIVVGGRPGLGKSALMAQMIFNAGLGHRPGLIASLEMSAGEIAGRGLKKLPKQRFAELPVLFAECSDFQKLTSLIRLAKRRHSVQLAAVDYLQLIESPNARNEMRERQVATMSRGLKRLAMELQIPILLGSQLNRESEKRGRPSLADLRESGAIEQDSDIVILIAGDAECDERELIIAKHRGGPVGMVETTFDRPKFWFGDSEPWTGDL